MERTEPRRRVTSQGEAVEQELDGHDGFRSAQDIFAALRISGHKIGLSTVYRHLQALSEQGRADVIHNAEGEARYRYCGDATAGHHHHLVCRRCGQAVEVEGKSVERWAAQTAQRHGYVDGDHTIEIFGTCPACARKG